MEKIIIKLQTRSYPVIIADKLFNNFSSCWPLNVGDTVVVITNDRVAPIYLNILSNLLIKSGINTDQLILPDGEQNKSLTTLDTIFTKLLKKNYDRSTILIALGGGVIGDITGFAAAIYQRGIRFIQVPTTLLAQVDASIGGKTGINHTLGKNMIGAFHQPIAVMINLDVLSTLTTKEFSSGLSEIIKYAIALDSRFFSWLESHLDDLLILHLPSLVYCIRRCCELKASIITIDERDQDIRSILNLGHTYGHAIESYLGYSQWSHGESIAAGIMMAVNTALRLNQFNFSDARRIKILLTRAGLPVRGPKEMTSENYLEYMTRDKKSTSGQINLVLPVSIGNVKTVSNVNHELVSLSIEDTKH
ncbi:3-dehydroquinate synthase [Blochmannia endosymbiont of Camponotus sp. C-046]|uniref:3-dehydroquinate synthase n=1 Tax=Blochmannia endosymbiont of Camponotus sp. C-046 TaxID=2945589 RepID=UPI002024908B|nr:3-dehydroquinate synthase [Blochmannia endosymbiont of Camponotus sp. C-046]URJ28748.1 3-dehydroquinate synthase [Blochmannia endosymbiont of Camponotus sp. C-046]